MIRIACCLGMVIYGGFAFAQTGRKITRQEYIDTYKELAMKEMERSGIPASITLAQGILESGDGNSTLARKSNNHFGIKCHDWKGKSVNHDDDEKGECFRKYKSVEESFHDHSDFLTQRSRYAELFTLKPDDYKAWARGLKKAGYATSPTYAEALIKIIEENELYKYDREVLARKKSGRKTSEAYAAVDYAGGRKIHYNNRVKYVLAREGDSFYSLSEELDLFQWQLPKYNDLPEKTVFSEGDIVYLQPKRNKAEPGKDKHVVKEGESLHDISQLYGIKLSRLAEKNLMVPDSIPGPGSELLLRSGKKGAVKKTDKMPRIEPLEQEKNSDTNEKEFIIEFDPGD
jgi:hypothetical protein